MRSYQHSNSLPGRKFRCGRSIVGAWWVRSHADGGRGEVPNGPSIFPCASRSTMPGPNVSFTSFSAAASSDCCVGERPVVGKRAVDTFVDMVRVSRGRRA